MKHSDNNFFSRAWRFLASPATVYILFLAVILVPNVILAYTEPMPWTGRVANILLPAGVYWLLMSITRRLGLTIWLMFPILFFAAFQLVLLDLYGRSIIAVDMFLNVVTTNPGEAGELLGNLGGVIMVVIVLYVPSLVWATIALVKHTDRYKLSHKWLRVNRRVASLVTLVGVVFTAVAMTGAGDYRLKRDLYPVNVVNNLVTAFEREAMLADYDEMTRGFKYDAHSEHPDSVREIYVLVVGETSRAANWQLLGYERETNPLLSSIGPRLMVFDHAMSESNTTHKSVPMLMTPLSSSRFNDLYHSRGIITAFKEAGFKTAFFSNQQRNHSFIDFFGEEADTCLFIKETERFTADGEPHDISLVECLDQMIARGDRKLFVVLHGYGSHFKYEDRYDDSSRRFVPDKATNANTSNRQQLVNAYDNSILATDRFLYGVINTLDSVPGATTAMLFTSDHGEDIFDDPRGLFLHASPCPTLNQLHVPIVAWVNSGYEAANPEETASLRSHRANKISTTRSFFHTMLQMAGVTAPCFDPTASLASPQYRDVPRRYINDHNESVDLKQAGFTKFDFDEMSRRHL